MSPNVIWLAPVLRSVKAESVDDMVPFRNSTPSVLYRFGRMVRSDVAGPAKRRVRAERSIVRAWSELVPPSVMVSDFTALSQLACSSREL